MQLDPKYFALEGVDTAGKSTQIALLQETPELREAVFTKEPSHEKITQIILTQNLCPIAEFLLFTADRTQHFFENFRIWSQKIVISDRSLISGIAYAKNIDVALKIHEILRENGDIFLPKKLVILWLDERTLRTRLSKKTQDVIENRGVDFLLAVQENMKKIAQILKIQTKIIDAAGEKHEICREIREFLL